ncbi:MAG TPA: dihydroorotase [Hellea balneolensis]|uniref:Dihydroorotase n=1 Tax=Hellea balneolensis TaxID=287478 RepID=A0A7C5R131_9PROT|nr:dihydroorotase [Hellea balneolensis]
MTKTYDMIIRGGIVVNHDGRGAADIGIQDGKISAIGDLSTVSAGENIDARGLHVLPGVIDTQVHFREPGPTHKEDLEAGSRGAVLGGVTGVFEMPNTNPNTATPEALSDKLNRANARMHCHHAFYIGGTHDNADHLDELERLPGCCGVKVFMGASTGDLLIADEEGLSRVLASINRRASFHCEDEARMQIMKDRIRAGDPTSHPEARDAKAAYLATAQILRLARKAAKRVHILHVTTGDEIPLLVAHKDIATCEVTPQHLTLSAPSCYETLGTRAQMNPPVRREQHRAALWQALAQGVFDVIGSDHAPHTLKEKAVPYPASPSGMPGVQTLVPVMLDWVNKGYLSIERFVDLTSAGANRIWGLAGKGRLAVGYDADVTIVDLKAKHTLSDKDMANKSGWTPYDGMEVTGWPTHTIIDGKTVMQEGELVRTGQGTPYRFMECL